MAAAKRPASEGPAGVSVGMASVWMPRKVVRHAWDRTAALRRARQVLAPRRRNRRRGELDEDVGAWGVRLGARVHVDLVREAVRLAAVARGARGDDVVPAGAAALGARDDVVDGQARAGAAVLAHPAVAGEHGAAGGLALVRVAWDAHGRDPAGDDGARGRARRPVQVPRADLDDLGLVLEQEDRRAPDGADVDGLVRRVEDEHTTTTPTATRAVSFRSVPRVVAGRHGPQWSWGHSGCHDPE